MLSDLLFRLRSLFKRSAVEGELDEELQFHFEQQVQKHVRSGLTREEAMRRARLEFGGADQIKEECRDARGIHLLEIFLQDLRYGLRILARSPGFVAIAVLTLALGIGANATIFSFIDALLLHPPSGIVETGRLVSVWNRTANGQQMQFSYPDYLYFRDHNQVFSDFIAYSSDPMQASWTQAGHSSLIYVRLASANYFSTLGVKAFTGRGFFADEDNVPGKHPVVVLSRRFWQERMGSDPGIVGKTLTLNARTFTVVGVAPADFSDLEPGFQADAWAPISMQKELAPGMDLLGERTGYWIFVVGRLKAGVSPKQAQANASVLAQQLAVDHPDTNKGWDAVISPLTGLDPEIRGNAVAFGTLLMVLVALVLLIACANAANLLLARASPPRHETAIPAALGAKRSRIVCQVLTESILLSLMAGFVGILISIWAGPLILALKPSMLSFIKLDLPLDWRLIVFTLVISTATGVIFGLAPALNCSKVDVISQLKDETLGSHRKSRFSNALIVIQVALCVVLLIGASLCLRSLWNARSIDPGFEVIKRLAVSLDLRILGYSDARGKVFYSQLLERLRALPGVRSASATDYLPLGFEATTQGIVIEGEPPDKMKGIGVGAMSVGPDYFKTMGIPLLEGREFSNHDNELTPAVIIVNEALAHQLFPGQNVIGKRLSTGRDSNQQRIWSEIVGVVKTGKYRSLRETSKPFLYHAFFQAFDSRATIVVESTGDPRSQLPAVRGVIQSLDPALPIIESQTMSDYMKVPLFPAHITGVLLSVFGGVALVLTMVGLYGVIAYSIVKRTREIGIRVALGANRRDVLRLVLGQGLKLTLAGAAIGLLGALAVTRLIQDLLYGVSATDPTAFAVVTILLALVALAACYIPARRAMRVDPMDALRYE